MDADSHFLAELDDVFGSGSAPVLLGLGRFRLVPVVLFVPIFRDETRAVGLRFELLPVKRNRRRIEKRAVQRLVLCVERGVAELVEVEEVRAENEVVRNLFDDNLRAVLDLPDVYDGVRLAVRLDVGVDFPLNVIVPDVPILLRHNPVGVLRRILRNSELFCLRRKRPETEGNQRQKFRAVCKKSFHKKRLKRPRAICNSKKARIR